MSKILNRTSLACLLLVVLIAILTPPLEACETDSPMGLMLKAGERREWRMRCDSNYCVGNSHWELTNPGIVNIEPQSFSGIGSDWVVYTVEGIAEGSFCRSS